MYAEITPKTSPVLWWPQKTFIISPYPKNIYFCENQKNIYNQNFKPKIGPSLRIYENIRDPSPDTIPWGPCVLSMSKIKYLWLKRYYF